jgi:hypothetical protein
MLVVLLLLHLAATLTQHPQDIITLFSCCWCCCCILLLLVLPLLPLRLMVVLLGPLEPAMHCPAAAAAAAALALRRTAASLEHQTATAVTPQWRRRK